ncbi:MAG: hypothetical protein ACK473_11995, partial [Sphingomonadales bacterium]
PNARKAFKLKDLFILRPFRSAAKPEDFDGKTSCTAHSLAFPMAKKGEQTVRIDVPKVSK